MVVGENEEGSPWEPLHVEHGLEMAESAVTMFFPNTYAQLWQYGSDAAGILNTIIYNLLPGRGGLTCLLLTPPQAQTLAKDGWSKAMIRKYVYEFGRVPAYRHRSFHGVKLGHDDGAVAPPNGTDAMAILPSPDHLRVLVTGGPGAFIGVVCGAGLPGRGFVTRKIRLPARWPDLLAKYRGVVPAYERY